MFTPKKINLNEINGGARYVDGNEVSPEAINRPIEASAYAQKKADEAITKADIAMEKVNDSEIGEITLSAYPVGSIYMSINSTSPAVLFGGTWEAITGRFLIGSGEPSANTSNTFGDLNNNSYVFPVEEKGGQYRHQLTIDEMPSHNHNLARPKWYSTDTEISSTAYGTTASVVNEALDTYVIKATGGNGLHNIMNPYYVVNIWKRIA